MSSILQVLRLVGARAPSEYTDQYITDSKNPSCEIFSINDLSINLRQVHFNIPAQYISNIPTTAISLAVIERNLTRVLRSHHRFMDVGAMAHEVLLRRHELLQRRVDIVEMNVGDEAVDAGIDAGRLWPV